MRCPNCDREFIGMNYSITRSDGSVLYFCRRMCGEAYSRRIEFGVRCAQCHEVLHPKQRNFGNRGPHSFCSWKCSDAYQEKENEMEYRGHTITVKMFIITPKGSMAPYNMPASTFQHEAETKIDKMLAAKCHRCGAVIEPGALYVNSQHGKFCSLSCYTECISVSFAVPNLKRLDPASGGD